jgi:hypothetical protein
MRSAISLHGSDNLQYVSGSRPVSGCFADLMQKDRAKKVKDNDNSIACANHAQCGLMLLSLSSIVFFCVLQTNFSSTLSPPVRGSDSSSIGPSRYVFDMMISDARGNSRNKIDKQEIITVKRHTRCRGELKMSIKAGASHWCRKSTKRKITHEEKVETKISASLENHPSDVHRQDLTFCRANAKEKGSGGIVSYLGRRIGRDAAMMLPQTS